jgi:hypothetical protein
LETTAKCIEAQIREYAENFLRTQYGEQTLKKLEGLDLLAVDAYDSGGISEATEKYVKIAVKRDVKAGKLTNTTKLIVRHELGHILDENTPAFPEFEEEIEHEKIAWQKAKPKNAAENWYKNVSIRTHVDPLKMQSCGFPRPETKISWQRLRHGTNSEIRRMKQNSSFVDSVLAERFAMANLIENPNFYA